jgi:hypothetical protein
MSQAVSAHGFAVAFAGAVESSGLERVIGTTVRSLDLR